MGTRIAYGGGDTACNVVFGALTTILVFFYTDYVGIEAATIGFIMLLSRIFDGLFDVVMGIAIDKTNSKYGKSRPWILWMSAPFAISIVAMFTIPDISEMGKFIYVFVTYNLCTTVFYTAINLPYGSLSTMMTRVAMERDMLCIVRMGMAPIGKILAVSATLPIVELLGNSQAAWVKTMSIWAVMAFVLLIICFWKCKETVKLKARINEVKIPFKKSVKALLTNKYFYIVTLLWIGQCGIFTVTGTILPYYAQYIFHDKSLFSILFLVETISFVVTIFACPSLLKKYGKRKMSMIGIIFALVGHVLFLFNPLDLSWIIVSCLIRGIGLAPLNSVFFGFLAEVVEYGQWKTHIRQEGMIFAGGTIGAKFGMGIATAILTGLLSLSGYISSSGENVIQPQSAIDMIMYIYMFGPIVIWAIILIGLYAYKLDKQYAKIMEDLVQREAEGKL